MSDSVRPHRQQPTRLPRPWDSPGKNTGVGCHFLLQCMEGKGKVKSLSCVRLLAAPWTAARPPLHLYLYTGFHVKTSQGIISTLDLPRSSAITSSFLHLSPCFLNTFLKSAEKCVFHFETSVHLHLASVPKRKASFRKGISAVLTETLTLLDIQEE